MTPQTQLLPRVRGEARECQHPQAQHQHGTVLAYIRDRCGCQPCTKAGTDYARTMYRRRAYGQSRLVDAEPVRAHIRWLQAQGMGLATIRAAAGMGGGVMCDLLYGRPSPDGARRPPVRRIKPETAAAVLAVTCQLAPSALTDGTGTRRRLQALVCMGWSQYELAGRLGYSAGNFGKVVHATRVTAATADAVAGLYDQLWDTPPPQTDTRGRAAVGRAKHRAQERGWLPPLAWDDDTIDDPTAAPDTGRGGGPVVDEVAIEQALTGRRVVLTKAELNVAIRVATDRQLSARRIGELLRTTPRKVNRERAKVAA